MENKDKELILVLLGKVGTGKSATGNSILGKKKFDEASTPGAKTSSLEYGQNSTKKITVYDTMGMFNADVDTFNQVYDYLEHIKKLLKRCQKVDAFLFVIRYGSFSNEDVACIKRLKEIFGQNFFKDHVYLVMTHGDTSKKDKEEDLREYCENSEGKFKQLYEECDKRLFLITNNTPYNSNSKRIIKGAELKDNLVWWCQDNTPFLTTEQNVFPTISHLKCKYYIIHCEEKLNRIRNSGKYATDKDIRKIKYLQENVNDYNFDDLKKKVSDLLTLAESLKKNSGCTIL